MSAAPAGDYVASGIVGDTLAVGGVADSDISTVRIEFGGRVQRIAPAHSGAWLSVFEHVHLPAWLAVRELDTDGQVAREILLPFEEGHEQHEGLLRRTSRRLRFALDLPSPVGLPRRSTTYPSPSLLRRRPFRTKARRRANSP